MENESTISIKQIFDEINLENGSNYKKTVLEKYKSREDLIKVFQYAYDRVKYVYGVTLKNVSEVHSHKGTKSLEDVFIVLDQLANRDVTGNAAISLVENTLYELSEDDAYVFERIIDRNLKLNMGTTNIEKVIGKIFTKTPYMRCGIAKEKQLKSLNWEEGIYSQLKLDGTYRSFNSGVFTSRSGKSQSFPKLESILKDVPSEYVLIGEMTLKGETDRAKGNGLINSDNIPEDDIVYTIWDAVHIDEYKLDRKLYGKTRYEDRFEKVKEIVKLVGNEQIEVVPHKIVYSPKEAFEHFQEVTSKNLEGTVIKTKNNLWRDYTGKEQLKLKLEIDADVRITGFTKGNNKRSEYFGAIEFANDEGTIKGRTSGFSDEIMKTINENKEEFIGKIIAVQFNDLSKAKNSDTWALSHPRFIEIRDDKTETDTLERVLELRDMAMMVNS